MELSFVKEVVEDNYNIKVSSIEKIKNVYKITEDEKQYCLKVVKYQLSHFMFILGAIKHLQKNGFSRIPEIIKTKENSDYIALMKFHAYLTPWISARTCNYDNPLDLETAARKLAELHVKSQDFHVKEFMQPRIGWFKWIETFSTRRDEILDFRRRISSKESRSEFDELYFSIMEEELERAALSIENLYDSDYLFTMRRHFERKGFCHHDYAHHNVLIDDMNEINIIDFDYCILDTHLHDLSSILLRSMKNGKWDGEIARYILCNYNDVNPIEEDELPIMAAFMEFPQDYWQTGIQYYWEQQPWGEEFFVKKLQKIMEDREEKQEFINDFRLWKKKHWS